MIDFPSLTVLGIREDTEGVFGGGRGELVRRRQASHAEKFMNLSSPRTRNVTMLKRCIPANNCLTYRLRGTRSSWSNLLSP